MSRATTMAGRIWFQETMMKGIALWMLGIPLPLILLGYCTGIL
jgi:hypothetical protein